MIKEFTDRFVAAEPQVRAALATKHPSSYAAIVRLVIETVTADDAYEGYAPDPERIVQIDHGDYQGTLLFVVGAKGYQPHDYWFVKVHYGSCSGCDTLQAISGYSGEPPTSEQVNDYWTLALHIAQGLKPMQDEE